MTDPYTPQPVQPPEAPTQAWTPPVYEAAVAPAVPAPVQVTPTTPAKSGRGGRLRWAAAIAIVAVVLGSTVAVAALITGSGSQATVLRYVPKDTVVYGELRLDLPGDQRQAAGAFLSKFPGFADQAALDTKLDEALDQLVGKASNDKQTFTKDIKPWFGGEFAFAVGPLPKGVLSGAASGPTSAAADARALLLISVKDPAAASAWFTSVLSDTGAKTTTETYQGTQLTIISPAGDKAMTAAFAILGGDVAVAGDVASVKAAVDTNGTQSLAGDPSFKAAAESAKNDYIGFAYVDTKALLGSMLDASSALGSKLPAITDTISAMVPDWTAYRLRVESDAIVGVATNPHVDRGYGPTSNRVNQVVDHVPSSAIALVAGNDVGSTWVGAYTKLGKDASLKAAVDAIDKAAGVFGGVSDAIGWIGDAGVVVDKSGSTVDGGVVVVPTDPAKSTAFFTTLKSFIALGGASAGLTVSDQAYDGTTITVVSVDLSKVGALAGGLAGGAASKLPTPSGTVDIAFATTDQVVVIGSSPAFVKAVLDTNAGDSVASTSGFQGAIGHVGKDVTGLTYVDLSSVRTLAEGRLSGTEATKYKTDVEPFLAPFEAFASTTTVGNDLDTVTSAITVK